MKDFPEVSDLKYIIRYDHAQLRAFAEHIIYKFGASSPCILDTSDFINPFAQHVARLFNGQMTCLFIKADGLTRGISPGEFH